MSEKRSPVLNPKRKTLERSFHPGKMRWRHAVTSVGVNTLERENPAHPLKEINHPLFPTQRAYGFTPNTLTHVIKGLYRQAELNGATSYCRRRGFLTRLSEKGVSVRVYAKAGFFYSVTHV